jgi:hypothetical protein
VGWPHPLLDGSDESARIGNRDGKIAAFVAENAAGVTEPRILVDADGEDVECRAYRGLLRRRD